MRNWREKSILLVVFWAFLNVQLVGQNSNKIEALNSYVQFLNESVHGLFTAHALMVISNKEVNRYIDLDSYIINNISNDEVQSNLFDKSDKENYTTFHTYSPIELKDITKEKSKYLAKGLASKLNAQVNSIVGILNKINQLRIDIDNFIGSHDLNEKESIYGVFEYLENGVQLFNSYANAHAKLSYDITKNRYESDDEAFVSADAVHKATQSILRNLRKEEDGNVSSHINNLKSSFSSLNEIMRNRGVFNKSIYKNNVKSKVESAIELMEGFEHPGFVPVEHELYGKHYFYHNEVAKRYFNWAGPGYVRHLNTILQDLNISFVNFVEEPLIFKVVYPMKMDEVNTLEQKKTFVDERKPKPSIKELKLSQPNQRRNTVNETNSVTVEIFDFNMFDRDSISVSFNGKMVLEDYMLTPQKKVMTFELIDHDGSYLDFEAKNWGIRAPNTFAVAYRYKGERKRIYAEYNLNKNEKIRIELANPK